MAILEGAPQQGQTPDQPLHPRRVISRRNLLKAAGVGAAGLATAGGLAALNRFGISGEEESIEGQLPSSLGIDPDQKLPSGVIFPNPDGISVQPTQEGALTQPTPEVTNTPEKEPTTIKEAANRLGLRVGVFMSNKHPEQLRIMANDFNYGQIYVGWPYSEASPGQFDTTSLRFFSKFAEQNGMKTQAGMLVWPVELPNWIKDGALSRDEMIKALDQHIKGLMVPYKGKVSEWIVVNESYNVPFRANDIFHQTIGPEYIDLAFQSAREADPAAKLIYNYQDNHTKDGQNTKLTREITERLKRKGLIDGVGLQMHLNGARLPDMNDVIETMQSYGLPVYITELDINMRDVPGDSQERFALQAKGYGDVVKAARKSGVVKGITIFGIRDSDSVWETQQTLRDFSPNADSLLFDDNFNRKPAYDAVLSALS